MKQLDIIMIELCGDQTVQCASTKHALHIKQPVDHHPHQHYHHRYDNHHHHHRHDNHRHHCCDFVLDPPAFVRQQLPGKTAPTHQVVVVVEVVVAHQVVEVVVAHHVVVVIVAHQVVVVVVAHQVVVVVEVVVAHQVVVAHEVVEVVEDCPTTTTPPTS